MIITYTKIKEEGYLSYTDEWEMYGDDFDYEPDWEDEVNALANLIYDSYFSNLQFDGSQKLKIVNAIEDFVRDSGRETIKELEEAYYDDLKEWFEDEAFENLEE